jgi:hypothetical protein
MAPPKRPTLTNMAVQKGAPIPAQQEQAAPVTAREPVPRKAPGDLKTVQVRINKKGWMALRMLASEQDLSLEALMVEALNGVLLKYSQPPIVERRTNEKGDEGQGAEAGM